MKRECEINELLDEFAALVHDEFGAWLVECWRKVGGDEQDLHEYDCSLRETALAELGCVSADDVANTLRDIIKASEQTRYLAVERLRKMGLKP